MKWQSNSVKKVKYLKMGPVDLRSMGLIVLRAWDRRPPSLAPRTTACAFERRSGNYLKIGNTCHAISLVETSIGPEVAIIFSQEFFL